MVNMIDFSPIKTILQEEESHNSASTTSPNLIYTEAPIVPLLTLDELPTPHLPYFDDNVFDVDYSNSDIDVVFFGSCEYMSPLSGPCRDDSCTTNQSKNDCRVENIIY
jgi:hypothetical protein